MANWTSHDEGRLRILYPTMPQETILDAYEGKFGWRAIVQKANKMGLSRVGWGGRSGSLYIRKGYCASTGCKKWHLRKELKGKGKNLCPECGNIVRLPGPKSYRRKK